MINPIRWIVTECLKLHVNSEMVTKYSQIFLASFDEYFVNLCNNSDQTILLNTFSLPGPTGEVKTLSFDLDL